MKRVFGVFEAVFDITYLSTAMIMGALFLRKGLVSAGFMALLLAGGDAFHLIPRVRVILTGKEEELRAALGRGKQIASITMTVFYIFLWRLGGGFASNGPGWLWDGMVLLLASVRIVLCLLPQNRWQERYPPVGWGCWRNLPFFLLGLLEAARFFILRKTLPGMEWMWLAILLSFLFYLPVVLWVNKKPKVGMLMLPKTCMYLWMLSILTSAGGGGALP